MKSNIQCSWEAVVYICDFVILLLLPVTSRHFLRSQHLCVCQRLSHLFYIGSSNSGTTSYSHHQLLLLRLIVEVSSCCRRPTSCWCLSWTSSRGRATLETWETDSQLDNGSEPALEPLWRRSMWEAVGVLSLEGHSGARSLVCLIS